jgi:hypothetical protein
LSTLKIIALIFLIVCGIPNQIIDYKHRKRKAYEHGNAWAYYSQLSKKDNWEGRFMMWSGYLGFYLIIGTLCYGFYVLAQ